MSISSVPVLRSSAKRRMVNRGGINKKMSQNANPLSSSGSNSESESHSPPGGMMLNRKRPRYLDPARPARREPIHRKVETISGHAEKHRQHDVGDRRHEIGGEFAADQA